MEKWKIIGKEEGTQAGLNDLAPEVIPVVEEHLHVGKRTVETGKVNISKKVITETYAADIPLLKEEVIVEKKPLTNTLTEKHRGCAWMAIQPLYL